MVVSLCFYTDTARYIFLFELNVRTFDEHQKKKYITFYVQSEKKKGPERDSNSCLSTLPLSHQNIQQLERPNFIILT